MSPKNKELVTHKNLELQTLHSQTEMRKKMNFSFNIFYIKSSNKSPEKYKDDQYIIENKEYLTRKSVNFIQVNGIVPKDFQGHLS